MKRKTRSIWRQILKDRALASVVLGAGLLIVGLFMPWYTANSADGIVSPGLGITDDSGALMTFFALATVAASVSIDPRKPKNTEILGVVASVLIGLIMLNNWPDDVVGEVISTDYGYWMGIVGTALMFLGSLAGIQMTDNTKGRRRKKGRK